MEIQKLQKELNQTYGSDLVAKFVGKDVQQTLDNLSDFVLNKSNSSTERKQAGNIKTFIERNLDTFTVKQSIANKSIFDSIAQFQTGLNTTTQELNSKLGQVKDLSQRLDNVQAKIDSAKSEKSQLQQATLQKDKEIDDLTQEVDILTNALRRNKK